MMFFKTISYARRSFLIALLLLTILIVIFFVTESSAKLETHGPKVFKNNTRFTDGGAGFKRSTSRAPSSSESSEAPKANPTNKPIGINTIKIAKTKSTSKPTSSSPTIQAIKTTKNFSPLKATSKPISSKSAKQSTQATKNRDPSKPTALLSSTSIHFDARDVTYFLESHPAHSIFDPRAYFTEERTIRSLAIILNGFEMLPSKIRFAYMVRVFNELGRKIASKLNYYSTEAAAILRKTPDDLGNKPEVSMIVDVVSNAFESKEDNDPKEEKDAELNDEHPISKLINSDKEKYAVFNSSLIEISSRFAHIISFFVIKANESFLKIPDDKRESMVDLLGESLQMGAKTLVNELSKSDKYRVPNEIVGHMDRILNMTLKIFKRHIRDNDDKVGDSVISTFRLPYAKSFKDLNPISDKTGLIGPWNSYLFTNLGTSERVIKLFSALLSRVPPEAKSRWVNMYISQVNLELERALSGFVVMQSMPHNKNRSELFLLDPLRSVQIMPVKILKPRSNYLADKNRIPARCYLAGRRWRLVLTRALKGYAGRDEVIRSVADKIGLLKIETVKQSGNEIYRLCMPRLEVGLRGWGINGDPQPDGGQSNKFPMKNPIEDMETMSDPFISGIKMGYKLGVKIGYNEERNATLEMERASTGHGNAKQKAKAEVEYIGRASYRKAATIGAKKAFEIAVREGYLTTLKVSMRAGMLIPSEAGSKMASLRCVSYGGQIGMEAGRSVIDSYLVDNSKQMSEHMRKSYIKVGVTHGLLAGEVMGQTIGAIVGKEAAEEAYRRGIIRGGKVARAKFHLEEYEAGANMGFDFGLKEGKRIASSSNLDPSAPKFFRLPLPVYSEDDKNDHEVDHWEKDLIPPLSTKVIKNLQMARNHTSVSGSLKGIYKIAIEGKKGFKRVSYSNITYNLEVFADGFIMNNVAYLTLNGTINKMGILHGSLIARDIFNDDKDS